MRTQFAAVPFGFQPTAQARVVNLRTSLPEGGFEEAGYLKVIELKLNHRHMLREILLNVLDPYVKAHCAAATGVLVLRLDYHLPPPEGA